MYRDLTVGPPWPSDGLTDSLILLGSQSGARVLRWVPVRCCIGGCLSCALFGDSLLLCNVVNRAYQMDRLYVCQYVVFILKLMLILCWCHVMGVSLGCHHLWRSHHLCWGSHLVWVAAILFPMFGWLEGAGFSLVQAGEMRGCLIVV